MSKEDGKIIIVTGAIFALVVLAFLNACRIDARKSSMTDSEGMDGSAIDENKYVMSSLEVGNQSQGMESIAVNSTDNMAVDDYEISDEYELSNYLGMTEKKAYKIFGEDNFQKYEGGGRKMVVSKEPGNPIYSIFISHGLVTSVYTYSKQYMVLGIKPGDDINMLPDEISMGRISAVRNHDTLFLLNIILN